MITKYGVMKIIDVSPTIVDDKEYHHRQKNSIHLIIRKEKGFHQCCCYSLGSLAVYVFI
jgi:hypothetical protein